MYNDNKIRAEPNKSSIPGILGADQNCLSSRSVARAGSKLEQLVYLWCPSYPDLLAVIVKQIISKHGSPFIIVTIEVIIKVTIKVTIEITIKVASRFCLLRQSCRSFSCYTQSRSFSCYLFCSILACILIISMKSIILLLYNNLRLCSKERERKELLLWIFNFYFTTISLKQW